MRSLTSVQSLTSPRIHIGSPPPDQRRTRFWHLWSGHPHREPKRFPGTDSCGPHRHDELFYSLPLRKCPIVQPPVEPILVTSDILLHRDIDVRLEQRNAGYVGESSIDEAFHVFVVAGLV